MNASWLIYNFTDVIIQGKHSCEPGSRRGVCYRGMIIINKTMIQVSLTISLQKYAFRKQPYKSEKSVNHVHVNGGVIVPQSICG